MVLTFLVRNQTISYIDTKVVPRIGSSNYLQLKFNFVTKDWSSLRKTLHVSAGEYSEPFILESNVFDVPTYYTQQESFKITLLGDNESEDIVVPTNVLTVSLDESNSLWTAEPPDPQNSAYIELLNSIGNLDDLTTEAKDNLVDAINEAAKSSGGSVKPLIGTTDELTPEKVKSAVLEGQPVVVQYNDEDFGTLKFTNFNIVESMQLIVSQTIAQYNFRCILYSLIGNANSGSWSVQTAVLATVLMLDDFAEPFIIDYSNPATDDYTNAVAAFDHKNPVYLRKGNVVLPMTGYDNTHCYFGGTTSAYLPAGYVNAVYAHIGQNGENYYWYDYKVAIEAAGLFSADAGEYFTSTNVMGQLQEAGAKIKALDESGFLTLDTLPKYGGESV